MNVNVVEHEVMRKIARRSASRDWLFRHRWFGLFVVLPTLLAAVYYGLIASDIYVSQSTFVIKSPGQKSPTTLSLANLVQTSGFSGGQEQTNEVLQYVRSRNALKDLQQQVDVRHVYSGRGADVLSRYPRPFQHDSFENLYRYYGSMVGVDLDAESGLAVLQVRAFTPRDAYRINEKLLDLSEALVNRLNDRAQSKTIEEDLRRVAQAQERVREARIALSAYQNQQKLIDPTKQAEGVFDVSNKLVAEQAALQAQLQLMLRVAPRNPSIPAVRSRIEAIGRQIGAQNGRAVGTRSGIASKLANFEKLTVEQEFATQMLNAANASLESNRSEAQKQQYYLERVVEANVPDTPALPNRFMRVLVIFAALVCLYFIGWMLVVGILEHSPED